MGMSRAHYVERLSPRTWTFKKMRPAECGSRRRERRRRVRHTRARPGARQSSCADHGYEDVDSTRESVCYDRHVRKCAIDDRICDDVVRGARESVGWAQSPTFNCATKYSTSGGECDVLGRDIDAHVAWTRSSVPTSGYERNPDRVNPWFWRVELSV